MSEKKNSPNALSYIAVAVILILLYLYITKPTQNVTTQNNSGYQSNLSQLESTNQNLNSQLQQIKTNQRNPYTKTIYPNMTIIIPAINNSATIAFYNSTYNLYNNYTENGWYNSSFKVPYDGYLILYIHSVDAPAGTWSFSANSNSSGYEYYFFSTYATQTIYPQGYESLKPTAGFDVVPDRNTSFYQIIPILRGNDSFSFQNTNNYPISINFSLVYVGENYSDLTPISINYSTN